MKLTSLPAIGGKRLYLAEISTFGPGGGCIYRGYYARSPRRAVNELKKAFPDCTVSVMRFKILNNFSPEPQ